MKTKTATHILSTPEGTMKGIAPKDPKKGYSLAECQGYVGGMMEVVRLPGRMIMVVNEEGLLMGLPFNAYASALAGQPIVGNAMVVPSAAFK